MNTTVNFEIAKLLKKKGFNEEVRDYYEEKDGTFYHSQYFRDNISINEKHKEFVVAPTIAEVIMWLYEKHGIWISVDWTVFFKEKVWVYSIRQKNQSSKLKSLFNSPTEAYEAGINYTLTKLI